jgi:hypothetical protein
MVEGEDIIAGILAWYHFRTNRQPAQAVESQGTSGRPLECVSTGRDRLIVQLATAARFGGRSFRRAHAESRRPSRQRDGDGIAAPISAHLAIGLTHAPPALPMMALGAAFVLSPAAIWPSVPLIVEENRVGTALGVMTALQNVGLLAFPYVNGAIRDATHRYSTSQARFAALGGVGLAFAMLLRAAGRHAGGSLKRAK